MKLTIRNGEIELPKSFALITRRTNPILSDEGDTTITATLPSSLHNLAVLGQRQRIDRAERYENKVDAILEVGPVRKSGQLVMDTIHRTGGIDGSFAYDNSDLYAKARKKTLKEIFADYKETFVDTEDACEIMEKVYYGTLIKDYVVFPVAVAPYELNGVQKYQYNNLIDSNRLVWRNTDLEVYEGDVVMDVPDGYSVAPFLKLYRLVEIMFSILGYEVTDNCLADWPFQRMVIVHNCSDCLCNPQNTLYYRDLVPSCTLSDFLTWLNNKFHLQPLVNSETRQVKIVSMEAMLSMSADMDISGIVEGDFKVQLNPSKRIVLTPTNKIEGTEPAAATFDKLVAKYDGHYFELNETEFHSYPNTYTPLAPLALRRATGQMYAVEYDTTLAKYNTKLLGTNHFTYDRENSDDTEEFSQEDIIPLMLCNEEKAVTPFIGDRTHAHTSYKGSAADDKQDIILVQAYTQTDLSGPRIFYTTTGTTQPCIPYIAPTGYDYFLELGIGTTPYHLYDLCWSRYNNLLLNFAVHLTGRVKFTIGQVLNMDMSRLKICDGQRLLPVTSETSIGDRCSLTDAEYILLKDYVDGVTDSAIEPVSIPGKLSWEVTNDVDIIIENLWQQILGAFSPSLIQGVEDDYLEYSGYSIHYLGEDLQPGTPTYEGEEVVLYRRANITIYYQEIIEYEEDQSPSVQTFDCQQTFNNITVTFTFTAVTN